MVMLFSDRKNKIEKEIIEILTGCGANYISDRAVFSGNSPITIISVYKKTDLKLNKGIAVMLDNTDKFANQDLPYGIIGICEDTNINALEIFYKNNISVISCGMNSKNTLTLSSLNNENLFITLQRTITDIFKKEIDPSEFKIKLKKDYQPFSIMASIAIMLLCGVEPTEF
ncbi:MAG: hypothetical protein IJD55_01755 [Clostridia bacterium]|nr:hypothetical protein [Clostridia bacterium]